MTSILRQLPFQEQYDEVHVGLERIRVKPYQIIAWVSITARTVIKLPPHAPRLPAIVDTGHSHNFTIQERHIVEGAGLPTGLYPRGKTITVEKEEVPLYAATVWLHPNQPASRDRFPEQRPYRLELPEGIAVYPRGADFPRLPRLGLRALVRNKLYLTVDSERCLVDLRTTDWHTKLLRWLS